jgi:hypothetical protein
MARLGIAALVAAGLTAEIEPASSADLPLRPNHSREQDTNRSHQRHTNRPAKELLFREFLDWLKKR